MDSSRLHAAHAAHAPSTSLTSLPHADESHFVDYEELRRRQLLESMQGSTNNNIINTNDVSAAAAAAAAAASAAGIDTSLSFSSAPSDEGGARRNHQRSKSPLLPPRYAPMAQRRPPGRSPKGVADAHRQGQGQQQAMANHHPHPRADPSAIAGASSAPLDATEADFDELKSRTLLQAFGKMKRDQDERLVSARRPDPEAYIYTERAYAEADAHVEVESEADVDYIGQARESANRILMARSRAEKSYDNGASREETFGEGDGGENNGNDRYGPSPDDTIRSIERTLAEIRTERRTRQQYEYDGMTRMMKKDAPGEAEVRVDSQADGELEVKGTAKAASMTTRTTGTSTTTTTSMATATIVGNGRPIRRREKEPSPSPSGRYGAITPPPPEDGLDSYKYSDDADGKADPPGATSAHGHFDSPSALKEDVVVDDEYEQHSLVSALPSLGTDGNTDNDTLDDDHYFRQDVSLNPPTTPVRASVRSLGRSERLAFRQKTVEVQIAQRTFSPDGHEQQKATSEGNADAVQARSPSPLTEFLKVKKELASMPQTKMTASSASKSITKVSPDAPEGSSGDDGLSVGQTLYRNRRAETQENDIPIGTVEDEDRVLGATEDHRPPLNDSEVQAATGEYAQQLRARLPQVQKSGGTASNTRSPKRDMRKKSNRIRGAPPATRSRASLEEDTSLFSEGVSAMEKQFAEITTREGAGPDQSHSSSSSSRSPSSSESSSSPIAENVDEISPPPTPVRVVRRRERVQRERSRVNEDQSVATEDDQGLLQFMATSSVPSVSPYMHASPQDKGLPTKVDSSKSNKSASRATAAFSALSNLPESRNRRDKDDDSSRGSNCSNSRSTAASESESGEGHNRNRSINQGTPCIDNRGARPTRGTRKTHSAEARAASRDRRAVRRTKSGHSSFSRGDFSTPSDEHREYRRDEIFSGAYSGGITSRGSKQTEKRAISGNGNMESSNTMAARYVERGEYDRALDAFSKVLDSHTARYGEIHPFVASTMHNMGAVHSKNAKSQTNPRDVEKSNKDALLCFQNAARIARDALGSDHPNVAVSLVRLGFTLLDMEQFENALVTFNEALRVRVASLGPNHALCSKIHNNIGVACLQMKRFADAGDAFHSALKIQRNVLSRLSVDCNKGQVRQDFFHRAKLELADTLCNIASLNLNWAETGQLATNTEASLVGESISAFGEALNIRLEELGRSHPATQKTKGLLEKAREASATEKEQLEVKTSKTIAGCTPSSMRSLGVLGLSESIPSGSPATRGLVNDDDNSLAENSELTSQVLCSPGQMGACGLGGFYGQTTKRTTSLRSPKAKMDVDGPNCCPINEETTEVWVAPHCVLPPDERMKTDQLFSDDAPFKSILGWPEEGEKTVEDLFRAGGITIPGTESVGSSITMEKGKTADDNGDEESVMITTFANPIDDEKELPASGVGAKGLDGSSKETKKKKKSRRGLMLVRPSLRRGKPSGNGAQTSRRISAEIASTPTTRRKSILLRTPKRTNASATEIQDIDDGDNGDGGRAASWKQPSSKKVQKMLKNPEKNITALYAVGASHLERNEYSEAEAIFRTLLEHHQKKHGEFHPYVGSAMHNLGIVLLRAERYEDALAAFEDAVRVRKMMSTKRGSADVAVSLVKVGISNLLLKRFEPALGSFTEALTIRRRALGELHPSVGRVYNNIGCVNCELNQLNEACGAFEASLEVQRHALSTSVDVDNGPLQLGMSTTLSNLGYLYQSQGRHMKSVAALKEALVLQESILGKYHPTVIGTLDSLAEATARVNKYDDAIRLYNSCLIRHNASAKSGQMSSEQRCASVIVLFKISRVHLKQRDFDSAHRKLNEAMFYAKGLDDDLEEKIEAEIQKLELSRRGGYMTM